MNNAITSFSNPYRWLSNFWEVRIDYEGLTYPSTEHAYQAAKTLDMETRRTFTSGTAGDAKRRGRGLDIRADWEEVKVQVMLDLLRLKFARPSLAKLLLGTGERELVEGNSWGDEFWGVCRGRGLNMLGRLLMQVRAELRAVWQ